MTFVRAFHRRDHTELMSVGETFGNVVSGKGKGLSRDGASASLGSPAGSGRAVLWAVSIGSAGAPTPAGVGIPVAAAAQSCRTEAVKASSEP